MGDAKRDGEGGRAMRRVLDGLVLRHPVVTVVAALALVLAVGGGAAGLGPDGLGAGSDRAPAASGAPGDPGGAALERATVVRVVDGDTLVVSIDGREERVRLIGIDCPESVAPEPERNTPEGEDAAAFTKSLVKRGDAVWLERDENDVDQYGRLLRYVWLEEPASPDDAGEIGEKMLNGVLVREGYAQARRYGDDVAHASALETLGREASRAGRGVSGSWG